MRSSARSSVRPLRRPIARGTHQFGYRSAPFHVLRTHVRRVNEGTRRAAFGRRSIDLDDLARWARRRRCSRTRERALTCSSSSPIRGTKNDCRSSTSRPSSAIWMPVCWQVVNVDVARHVVLEGDGRTRPNPFRTRPRVALAAFAADICMGLRHSTAFPGESTIITS